MYSLSRPSLPAASSLPTAPSLPIPAATPLPEAPFLPHPLYYLFPSCPLSVTTFLPPSSFYPFLSCPVLTVSLPYPSSSFASIRMVLDSVWACAMKYSHCCEHPLHQKHEVIGILFLNCIFWPQTTKTKATKINQMGN